MTGSTERQSPGTSEAVQPCLWMSAGLVAYRLCDRNFDCEHCPLDAALRGAPRESMAAGNGGDGAASAGPPFAFPDDRRYGEGHTWAQLRERGSEEGELARVGVDAFAAALAMPIYRFVPEAGEGAFTAAGARLGDLELDGGLLAVPSPLGGRLRAWNPRWEDDLASGGRSLAAAPYDDGWIAEIALPDRRELDALAPATAARDQALLDLRRFRRRAALHLLAAEDGLRGPTLPDGGQVLTDLRAILGPRRYLELLRELIG